MGWKVSGEHEASVRRVDGDVPAISRRLLGEPPASFRQGSGELPATFVEIALNSMFFKKVGVGYDLSSLIGHSPASPVEDLLSEELGRKCLMATTFM